MTGLGSSILSCLSVTFFKGNISGFIYFICALVVIVSIFGILVIVLPPYFMNYWRSRTPRPAEELLELEVTRHYYEHKSIPMRRLAIGYIVTITIIVFVAIEAPLLAYMKVPRGGEIAIGVIIIVLTLSSFFMVLPFRCLGGVDEPEPCQEVQDAVRRKYLTIKAKAEEEQQQSTSPRASLVERCGVEGELVTGNVDGSASSASPTATQDTEPIANDYHLQAVPNKADDNEDPLTIADGALLQECRQDPRYDCKSIKAYLGNLDLWLVLLYFFCVFPMTYMVSFNSSTISIAMSGEKRSDSLSTLYTAFLGVGNAVGRIFIGIFEAYIQNQPKDRRRLVITAALPIGPILLLIAGILLMTIPGKVILLPYIIIYTQNGSSQATMALLFTCLFERFHSTLYTIGFVVTVVVVICFNRLLFGMWVDRRHGELGLPSSQECSVKSCVLMPIIVVTCMAAAGLVVSVFIHVRYMRFVRRMNKEGTSSA
ncbi:hypothetical protein STCU_05403 [Strigomonas culicis]|uniref:Nodulin-like domain-containing protein n=1 Tax=Strigomonas culicis TaxID=28005 RepID=S9VWJ8_9TRYP|nr:hypothetical protein STCU_05403 [Strigomonas culicis]|eukprot:EPY27935.1 hypothetical protein STCU_05403 [Strigomonas culicis]